MLDLYKIKYNDLKKIIALLLILSVVITGCVTKKHKGDLSKIGKAYHNTTAHYNGYFNAEELLVKNKLVLENQEKDNFNEIIPIYAYTNAINRKAVAPDMDIAIKKVSVVINKHPYSDWTDDSYLLFAKAQFYKGDYEGAEETLQYLIKNHDPSKVKKGGKKGKKKKKSKKKKSKKKKSKKKKWKKKNSSKKKGKKKKGKWKKKSEIKKDEEAAKIKADEEEAFAEREEIEAKYKAVEEEEKAKAKKIKEEAEKNKGDNSNYILKHRPCFQEAKLWLAKVKIERDAFSSAEFVLKQLNQDPKTFEFIKKEIPKIQSDLFLRQEKYNKTLESLDKAISFTRKKKNKARLYFVKAQIYDKLNKTSDASMAYKMVMKMKPNYDMVFRAKLNNILNDRATGVITEVKADKQFLKMTKDFKNYEYRDQIYFILAKSALQGNRDSIAIDYLKQSLVYNVDNKNQKIESYYLLSELYYNQESFVFAKNYYDSTLTVMAESDSRHLKTTRASENLKDIARYITTIKEEGRWVEISKMSPKEQEEIAKTILEEQRKQKIEKVESKAVTSIPKRKKLQRANLASGPTGKSKTLFFAYKPTEIQSGIRSFRKKWGERPLVDNWRRKATITDFDISESSNLADNSTSFEFTDKEIADVLKTMPTTPKALEESNTKIKDAYFYLGALFRDKLGKNGKCVYYEEKLNVLYPSSDKELDSWYYLYLAHTELNNLTTAKTYKDKIIAKYPNSTFGRVLSDPNYKGEKDTETRLNEFYKATYTYFSQGKYKEAMDKIQNVERVFGAVNPLGGKFALLNAMCLGNLKGKQDYIAALDIVIAQYPESAEEKRAKEIKRLLNGKMDNDKSSVENKSPFKFKSEKTHYCIVVFEEKINSFNDAKIAISDYNRKYEKLLKLRISNIYLGADKQTSLIVVRKFKNMKKATNYIDGVNKNREEFLPTELKFKVYILSQDNYRIILKNKSLEGYDQFYNDFYN